MAGAVVKELLRIAKKLGLQYEKLDGGHVRVYNTSGGFTTIPLSPGKKNRSMENSIHRMKKLVQQ